MVPMMAKPKHLIIFTVIAVLLIWGFFGTLLWHHFQGIVNVDTKNIYLHSQPLPQGTEEVIIWGLDTLEPTTAGDFPVNRYNPDPGGKADVGWVVNITVTEFRSSDGQQYAGNVLVMLGFAPEIDHTWWADPLTDRAALHITFKSPVDDTGGHKPYVLLI